MEKKIKILVLADSPVSATGFAQVSRNILNRLSKTGRYEFDVIGINHPGDSYDHEKYPYDVYLAQPNGAIDMFGRHRFVAALEGNQRKYGLNPPYDLIFTIQDSFIIEGLGIDMRFGEKLRVTAESWKRMVPPENWFKWIGYFPVDSELKENWVTRAIALPDYPVAYCEYGKKEMMKWDQAEFGLNFNIKTTADDVARKAQLKIPSIANRIQVVPHGVDLDVFHRVGEGERAAFRREFFNGRVGEDTFLVVNISRNQPRKDIPRTFKVFAELKKRVPQAFLYLHMQENDLGGNLQEMGRNYGLVLGQDYGFPVGFDSGAGYTMDIVNMIYNAADVCITTTLGEGWGFISTEAFATKTPLIAPNITSFIDILGADVPMDKLNDWLEKDGYNKIRGIPVLSGKNKTEFVNLGATDNERDRPITNVEDMVEKLIWVKDNPEKVKEIVERAYTWVKDLNWDNVVDKWDKIFMKAYSDLEDERAFGDKIDKVGRNEPCPCGSGNKFKNCHGSKDQLDKFKSILL